MCGIAGIFGKSVDDDRLVEAMATQMRHRGPDSSGTWVDAEAGIALSHRRLSIIELSAAGHQPIFSHCGRYVMSFNGEIYNHDDIRNELEQLGGTIAWKGHSDSETLIECVAAMGVKATLERLVGMFAFAIFDRQSRQLHLAVDRMGEKPLYYGWTAGGIAFASELGMAFQLMDDLLDTEAQAPSIGKDIGQDRGKKTLVETLGPSQTRDILNSHLAAARRHCHMAVGPDSALSLYLQRVCNLVPPLAEMTHEGAQGARDSISGGYAP